MPVEDIRGFKEKDDYDLVVDCRKYIGRYVDFKNAQSLGVVFGPNDLSYEDFKSFGIIKNKLTELEGKKHGRTSSNRINPRTKKGARRSN